MFIKKLCYSILLITCFVQSQEIYHSLVPSRDGKTKQIIQVTENQGKKLLAMASCSQCMPAVYMYHISTSAMAKRPVFRSSGIYVIQYDDDSYVSVAPINPKKELGKSVWDSFMYYNFYSKNPHQIATMSKEKIEKWAINLSKEIIANSVSIPVTIDNDSYFAAQPKMFDHSYSETIRLEKKEKTCTLIFKTGKRNNYQFLSDFSKICGVPVYGEQNNRREYVFLSSKNEIIVVKFANGRDLGKSDWGSTERYNYFHKNQQMINSLLNSKIEQEGVDQQLSKWVSAIKIKVEKEYKQREAEAIKNRKLPQRGFKNDLLEAQALQASIRWAQKYQWEETIIKAYFTSDDWRIYRHSLTGRQLGRRIDGIIVMKRPDGTCSYQYALFTQEYNDNNYQAIFTEGIYPGQQIMECENINE